MKALFLFFTQFIRLKCNLIPTLEANSNSANTFPTNTGYSGNKFTTIELDRSSTTLIVGENGAGKSTLLDALCYGLYGKGFRNLKKELLVNSINQKEMLIEIEFSIGKKNYKIIRGTRPNKF